MQIKATVRQRYNEAAPARMTVHIVPHNAPARETHMVDVECDGPLCEVAGRVFELVRELVSHDRRSSGWSGPWTWR